MRGYRLTTLGKVVLFLFLILLFLSTAYTVKLFKYRLSNSNLNVTSDNIVPTAQEKQINILENYSVPYVNKLVSFSEVNLSKLRNTKLTIYFEPDDDLIKGQYYEALDMFADVADTLKDFTIEVEGNCATVYTNVIDNKNNVISYDLSLSRARAVSNYLQEKGIDSNRIDIIGNGSNKPIKANTTEEGRKYNRRVDISFKFNIK